MMTLRTYIKQFFFLLLICSLTLFSFSNNLSAEEVDWIQVAKTNEKIQFIDINSIIYNNKGFLSVLTKFSNINPENEQIINSDSYLMAVDCKNRLFSKLPLNGRLAQVKNWEEPVNDKFIKSIIIKSCYY
tara:strand:- start:120 stop:509 length:390 start_codon:yes stop_codon:yes gene_type:complete